MSSQLPLLEIESPGSYVPRAQNLLQQIFIQHLPDFVDSYDERYAEQYGKAGRTLRVLPAHASGFRLQRVEQVVERLITCGDYSRGIARGRPAASAAPTRTLDTIIFDRSVQLV